MLLHALTCVVHTTVSLFYECVTELTGEEQSKEDSELVDVVGDDVPGHRRRDEWL